MPGPSWGVFVGIVALVTAAVVGLARLSAGAVPGSTADDRRPDPPRPRRDPAAATVPDDAPGALDRASARDDAAADGERGERADGDAAGALSFTTVELLANVAISHGLLGSLVVLGAWYAAIPRSALGVDTAGLTPALAAVGVALGVGLYAVDEVIAAVADRAGVAYSEALRAALAPDSWFGWASLLLVVLPLVAVFEELLFRAALVGALAAGTGVSPWALAVASSVLFGLAHGAQGRAGMAVAGLLGFGLAAAFVLTGSLLAVVVAHYLVNALEFVVHERPGAGTT